MSQVDTNQLIRITHHEDSKHSSGLTYVTAIYRKVSSRTQLTWAIGGCIRDSGCCCERKEPDLRRRAKFRQCAERLSSNHNEVVASSAQFPGFRVAWPGTWGKPKYVGRRGLLYCIRKEIGFVPLNVCLEEVGMSSCGRRTSDYVSLDTLSITFGGRVYIDKRVRR